VIIVEAETTEPVVEELEPAETTRDEVEFVAEWPLPIEIEPAR
jgi:hypothetical protein